MNSGRIMDASRCARDPLNQEHRNSCRRKLDCLGEGPGQFFNPTGVTFLNYDEILIANEMNHRIQQFNLQTGNFVKSFGKNGEGNGEFDNPGDICINDEGHVVVPDFLAIESRSSQQIVNLC